MPLDREKIAARLYPEILDRPGKRWSSRFRRGLSRLFHTVFHAFFFTLLSTLFRNPFRILNRWSRRHWKGLAAAFAVVIVWSSIHVYWYNKLIRLEYEVLTAWAQVEVERQRRYHIQENVVDLVIGYAEHERSLMVDLTDLRTRMTRGLDGAPDDVSGTSTAEPAADLAPPVPDPVASSAPAEPAVDAGAPALTLSALSPVQLDALFPEILLVAEQYPNLRVTENFQQLSEAIIATETRVAERIQSYNRFVNVYTTALKQFPGNMFASVWGFKEYEYYRPGAEVVEFHPMNYRGEALRPPEPAGRAHGPNG